MKIALALRKPVLLTNYRRVRKLLEVATERLNLLCAASGIYGFGTLNDLPYAEAKEDLFVIEFSGHYQWQFLHAGRELMVVSFGKPGLSKGLIDEEEFKAKVKAVFAEVNHSNLEMLWALVKETANQKHGAMIVISNKAEEEANRLKNQSTTVISTPLTPELMLPLSSIDGAILVDSYGHCHAIGVILDGIASDNGDPARGARYNSAIRYLDYVTSQNHLCIAIVISEDGTVDLLPKLPNNSFTLAAQ